MACKGYNFQKKHQKQQQQENFPFEVFDTVFT